MTLGALLQVQSPLDPAGPQAARLHHLWNVFLTVTVIVFVLVLLALALALLRARKDHGATPAPPLAKDPAVEGRIRGFVTAGAGITALILVALLVSSVSTGRGMRDFRSDNPLTIEVIGRQWWWEFRYRDPIPSQMVVTANELHIPVGEPVNLKLNSRDVIHSFWVPNLHGKRDLIPGQEASTFIQADQSGIYRGQCAEFCGHQHAHMSFLVIAEPKEAFQAWLAHQRDPAPEPTEALAKRGQEVFLRGPCVLCHTIQGTSAAATTAPNLTHLMSRQTIAAGTLPNVRGHLAGWILNSQSIKPGNHMPAMSLQPDDLQALLAYLETLK